MSVKNTDAKKRFDLATVRPERWWQEYEGIAEGANVLEGKVRSAHNALLRPNDASHTEDDRRGAIHFKRVEMLNAQAIECALKAVLAAKGLKIPKTHDLRVLIERAGIQHFDDRTLRYLDVLSKMNYLGRYPVTMEGQAFASWDIHKAKMRATVMTRVKREYDHALSLM